MKLIFHSIGSLIWSAALFFVFFYQGAEKRFLAKTYLKSELHPYLLIGGIALLILGSLNVYFYFKNRQLEEKEEESHHGSDLPGPTALLLMCAPLMVAGSLANNTYSEAHILNKTQARPNFVPSFDIKDFAAITPKTPDGFYQIGVADLEFAVTDEELRLVLQDLPVELSGQWIRDPKAPENERLIYRLFMNCCAADAMPIRIPITLPESPNYEFKSQAWVSVKGKADFRQGVDGLEPIIKVSKIESAPEPEESYLKLP